MNSENEEVNKDNSEEIGKEEFVDQMNETSFDALIITPVLLKEELLKDGLLKKDLSKENKSNNKAIKSSKKKEAIKKALPMVINDLTIWNLFQPILETKKSSLYVYQDHLLKHFYVAGAEWLSWYSEDLQRPSSAVELEIDINWLGSYIVNYSPPGFGVHQKGFLAVQPKNLLVRLGKSTYTLYSLALRVSSLIDPPWMGIFNLGNNRFWLLIVGEQGFILPNGDMIGDYDTVQKIFSEHKSYGNWNATFGGKENSIAKLMERLVLHEQEQEQLKNVHFTDKRYHVPFTDSRLSATTALIFVSIGFLCMILFFLLLFFLVHYWVKEHHGVQGAMHSFITIVPKLETMPEGVDFIRHCYARAEKLPVEPNAGWILDKVLCEKHKISITYKNTKQGLLSNRPEGEINTDWSQIKQVNSLNDSDSSINDALPDLSGQKEISAMSDFLKFQDIDGQNSFIPIKIPVNGGYEYNFSTSLFLSPINYLPLFKRIHGFRVHQLIWNCDHGWSIKMSVYTD